MANEWSELRKLPSGGCRVLHGALNCIYNLEGKVKGKCPLLKQLFLSLIAIVEREGLDYIWYVVVLDTKFGRINKFCKYEIWLNSTVACCIMQIISDNINIVSCPHMSRLSNDINYSQSCWYNCENISNFVGFTGQFNLFFIYIFRLAAGFVFCIIQFIYACLETFSI